MLIIGRMSVDFIRSHIILHISTRINIYILTDFIIKLFKLPLSFFDTRTTGDIMQRMDDQKRIESFLSGTTLNIIFTILNLLIFGVVLIYYSGKIFFIFLIASLLYGCWVSLFFKRRRALNYVSFDVGSKVHNSVLQLVNGVQEIKLNNCEREKRWEWESLQADMFSLNIKSLRLSQLEGVGTTFILESKNILITFLVAINKNISRTISYPWSKSFTFLN